MTENILNIVYKRIDKIITELYLNGILYYLLIGSVLILLTLIGRRLWRWWHHPRRRRHRYHRRRAKAVLKKLQTIKSPASQITYLRKINPLTFEELLMEAVEQRGFRVHRSKRYSGDGGIDGQFKANGHTILVQAKRYTGHIQAAHVAEFCEIVESQGCYGLFVHTGRAGRASYKAASGSQVTLLGGERLLNYLGVSNDNEKERELGIPFN